MDPQIISLNGMKDPHATPFTTLNEILQMAPNLEYWSPEALRRFFTGCIEMVTERFEGLKGVKINRQLRQLRDMKNIEDRKAILLQIYNFILRSEGMSPLPGFSFSNRFGNKLKGSPEYQSVLK